MTALLEDALEVLGSLEVDEVADRILATLVRATRARGAALWVARNGGELALHGRQGTVSHDAVAVPLLSGAETVGLVHLQPPDGALTQAERSAAAALARASAIALGHALRFEALRGATLRDPISGAYRLATLEDHAGKELDKARRYGRNLSFAVVTLEGVSDGSRREARHEEGAVRREMVGALSRAVRDADVLAHAGGGQFQILLPETDRFGALVFLRRAGDEVRRDGSLRRLLGAAPRVALGAATFPADAVTFPALVEACLGRQDEYRRSIVHALPGGGAELSFWDIVDLLTGEVPLPPGAVSARLGAGPDLFAALLREIAREIARTARTRGVAYVAAPSDDVVAPLLSALPHLEESARAGDVAARIHLLGPPSAAPPLGHPLVSRVTVEGDRRIEQHPFLLFLSHEAAYGAVQGEGRQLFHTGDMALVDLLLARLQHQYDLRPIEAV